MHGWKCLHTVCGCKENVSDVHSARCVIKISVLHQSAKSQTHIDLVNKNHLNEHGLVISYFNDKKKYPRKHTSTTALTVLSAATSNIGNIESRVVTNDVLDA
ncbi:hypothetical protein AVEN_246914-1 [Araneus ventricosus]|uniref:Uncharacterized protein n=1 Tax=Araneus ventricosus TaxID=182803 RepID=A0A4Y2HMZ5_ARAVE|nr:hypothetical protein AVEN_246914-1 [Araneus ventricosus]